MGRLGDTTIKYPSNGIKSGLLEEEICKSNDDSKEYRCAVGHCCADSKCCTYYYELWWFWLIWTLIILMSCCCAYHHRKKRRNLRSRRSRNANGQDPYAGACNYPGPPVDKGILGYCKLPKYEEVIRIPPSGSPPPPYRSRRALNTLACLEQDSEGVASMTFRSYNDLTSSVLSLVSAFGFTFVPRDVPERSSVSHTPPRREDNHCDGDNLDTSTDITCSRINIPNYGVGDHRLGDLSLTDEKMSVHIIDCQRYTEPEKCLDLTLSERTEDSSVREEACISSNNITESNLSVNCEVSSHPHSALNGPKEAVSQRESQWQDSGIGSDSACMVTPSGDSPCDRRLNDNNTTDNGSCTVTLPHKQNLVKYREKRRFRYSGNVRLGPQQYGNDDDDIGSSEDEEDLPCFGIDLNNNNGTLHHSQHCGRLELGVGSQDLDHEGVVLQLSPLYLDDNSGETSHDA